MNDQHSSVFISADVTAARQDVSATFMGLTDLSELVHTLPGFLLLLTSEGKLIYLSDNVSEHLGHTMVRLLMNYTLILILEQILLMINIKVQ